MDNTINLLHTHFRTVYHKTKQNKKKIIELISLLLLNLSLDGFHL